MTRFYLSLLGCTLLTSSAYAQIQLDHSDPLDNGHLTYAQEILLDDEDGVLLVDDSDRQNIQTRLGLSVTEAQTRYIRLDLSDYATFYNAPDLTLYNQNGTPTSGTLAQGGPGESFAIFEVTARADYQKDDSVVIDVRDLRLQQKSRVHARYRLYDTALNAQNEGPPLARYSAAAYHFAPTLQASAIPITTPKIDVTDFARTFVGGGTQTPVAQIELTITGALWTHSRPAERTDLLKDGSELVVEGSFEAAPRDHTGAPDPEAVTLNGMPATSLTEGVATFQINRRLFPSGSNAVIQYQVAGETAINAQSYSARYLPAPSTEASMGSYNLGPTAKLIKNGATDTAHLLLTPTSEGGVFRHFVRVSNLSAVPGEVVFHLRNDLGDQVSVPLSELGHVMILGAQQSTGLISAEQLYSAAQAANANFSLATPARNKLRLTVDGAFPAIGLDNVSVSRDNQRFATF